MNGINLDFNLTVGLVAIAFGITLASAIWIMVMGWIKKRTISKTRKEFESRMPLTIEEVEAERELTKARHSHDLRLLELRISELVLREAEANLKTQTALGRVGMLNDRIERLRLELAAQRQRKRLNFDHPENAS
jgi:hypothetical protein